jgi:hypothetical protein
VVPFENGAFATIEHKKRCYVQLVEAKEAVVKCSKSWVCSALLVALMSVFTLFRGDALHAENKCTFSRLNLKGPD